MRMENQFWFLEFSDRKKDETRRTYRERELYYDRNKDKWVPRKEYTGHIYPGCYPCGSYRAAKRHLRKHDEVPKGTKFRLISKYVGYDRYLMKH